MVNLMQQDSYTDFDLSGGIDEGNAIVIVLLNARCYGQDIGIEDDVIGIEA